MASREVIEYIKQELGAGHAPAQIKKALLDVGWSLQEVENAMTDIGVSESQVQAAPEVVSLQSDSNINFKSPAQASAAFQPSASSIAQQGGSPMNIRDRNLASHPIGSPVATQQSMAVTGSADVNSVALQETSSSFESPKLQSVGNVATVQTPAVEVATPGLHTASRPDFHSEDTAMSAPNIERAPQMFASVSPSLQPQVGGIEVGTSRLGAQSTGATLSDFTGINDTPSVTTAQTPDMPPAEEPVFTPGAMMGVVTPEAAPKKKRASTNWYVFIGFLLGVLVTLFIIGIYVTLAI
ncbi:MAG: hypothetical protein Q8Q18_00430 [bacterium]|nr:hypothetical protein [bacterium]